MAKWLVPCKTEKISSSFRSKGRKFYLSARSLFFDLQYYLGKIKAKNPFFLNVTFCINPMTCR